MWFESQCWTDILLKYLAMADNNPESYFYFDSILFGYSIVQCKNIAQWT